MKEDMGTHPMLVESEDKAKIRSPKALAHYLSSALHLEAQFSSSIYRDYMDPEDWPVELEPDVFAEIRKRLTVLIEDSVKHEQLLHGLTRQCADDENPNKKKVLRELELMEGFELSARDFYSRISSNPQLENRQLKDVLKSMAEAEQHHAEIVREIIELVKQA
jgi:rubrerythrin